MRREWHVSMTGDDRNSGKQGSPFRTISRAADAAESGDRVIVHEGTYREWVKPRRGGRSAQERIEYQAAAGEKVVIKGSEIIKSWEKTDMGTVWRCRLPNTFFGEYNPYQEILTGDWYIYDLGKYRHPGAVYLNGEALWEADSMEDLLKEMEQGKAAENGEAPGGSAGKRLFWYACADQDTTTIYGDFQEADPNRETVEIHVRKCCFYPEKTGLNYITVRGFEMAHAATPWAPPTSHQYGLLGVNWSKGWIIENNIIHDAKCRGISLGKEGSTGDNLCARYHLKAGYHYQMEAVFGALQIGWGKERIGSHIVRNNEIYDCGQAGIVGHMGCVFSEIYGNHIHGIGVRKEFFGWEIAGIKLHAAIDVSIRRNRIHDCMLGVWMDWQAQGTRLSGNLFYGNERDFMVEVAHGPYIVDNNLFLSGYSVDNFSQGGAYVHNLICGEIHLETVPGRSVPYHFPHSTQVAGVSCIYGGDDRYYGNIFVGKKDEKIYGTAGYQGHTASMEEFVQSVKAYGDRTKDRDLGAYEQAPQPVYAEDNLYLNGAEPFEKETCAVVDASCDPQIRVEEEGKCVWLEITAGDAFRDKQVKPVCTETLGMTRMSGTVFDAPDETSIEFCEDYAGNIRGNTASYGPLEMLKAGRNRIKIWEDNEK